MGLLEKAEKIQSDEDDPLPPAETPETVIVPEPEPVKKKEKNLLVPPEIRKLSKMERSGETSLKVIRKKKVMELVRLGILETLMLMSIV